MPTDSEIRDLIASALAEGEKSYTLPGACERLGLASGHEDEAFRSKRTYVKKRLARISPEDLIPFAETVVAQYRDFHLEEAVQLARDGDDARLSPLTRQRIFAYLASIDLSPKLQPCEAIGPIWPLQDMPSEDYRCLNLASEIQQHMILNDDWDSQDLLARLGVQDCSERRLFDLIERLSHPLCREGEEQDSYVRTMNEILHCEGLELRPVAEMSGHTIYEIASADRGVVGKARNIIFAANGPKPEIVLPDALNNELRIVKNQKFCLIYDRPLDGGLRWAQLVQWWADREGLDADAIDTERGLYSRLQSSLQSDPERHLFAAYFRLLREPLGSALPALIPQVYLHYDPYTLKHLGKARLPRQRMDFLILFSGFERIVIEVDGKQHYSDENGASPQLYAGMVEADRDLRLAGYELYRFGGYELREGCDSRDVLVAQFFQALMLKHSASLSPLQLRDGFLTGQPPAS